MFLKKLYQYNKWMFAAIVFFIVIQAFCFYKKGMVFSPWYNYGMYSEVMKPQEDYVVTKVYADNELLKGTDFSPQAWDRIHFNLQLAMAAGCNEHFYEKEVRRITAKFHLPVPAKWHYVNHTYPAEEISGINKTLLAQQLQHNKLDVYPLRYTWNGHALVFKDSLSTLPVSNFLCQ